MHKAICSICASIQWIILLGTRNEAIYKNSWLTVLIKFRLLFLFFSSVVGGLYFKNLTYSLINLLPRKLSTKLLILVLIHIFFLIRIGHETLADENYADDEIEIELAPIAVQLAYVQQVKILIFQNNISPSWKYDFF